MRVKFVVNSACEVNRQRIVEVDLEDYLPEDIFNDLLDDVIAARKNGDPCDVVEDYLNQVLWAADLAWPSNDPLVQAIQDAAYSEIEDESDEIDTVEVDGLAV